LFQRADLGRQFVIRRPQIMSLLGTLVELHAQQSIIRTQRDQLRISSGHRRIVSPTTCPQHGKIRSFASSLGR
jgi:hypothetical protein